MKKVSIITRAYNRLEYTTQCINNVKNNTVYPEYEHIIINNNSSDGTREWLNWIKEMENNWFEKVVPIHLNNNLRDFGGFREGANHVSEDSEYIVKLDNDIIVPNGWITAMVNVIENSDSKVVMLKRTGVKTIITPKVIEKIGDQEGGKISHSVACFMLRTKDFKSIMNNINGDSEIVRSLKSSCFKITNMICHQIEGWDSSDKSYIQHEKYPPSSKGVWLPNT
jgi:glycosyltransferase involved in cell wall biosynthesis